MEEGKETNTINFPSVEEEEEFSEDDEQDRSSSSSESEEWNNTAVEQHGSKLSRAASKVRLMMLQTNPTGKYAANSTYLLQDGKYRISPPH